MTEVLKADDVLREFAFREIRGAKPPSHDEMEAYGNALLTIAGADGEISAREWEFLEGLARTLGATERAIEKWRAFDFRHSKLETLLKNDHLKTRARALLYDAIRVSRADGVYANEEKAAARRAAKSLGVDATVLAAIEGLVEMESTLHHVRSSLLFS